MVIPCTVEDINKMGCCCSKESIFAMFRKKKIDPNLPRDPTYSILKQIHFPFKKKGVESGTKASSRPTSRPPSR
ncbi:unnamed protein product [Sphagnum compactum]